MEKEKNTSIFTLLAFGLALYANITYGLFILNPLHRGDTSFWLLTAIADIISIVVLSFVWLSAIFYEMNKSSYHLQLHYFKDKGKCFKTKKTAVFIPVVNEDYEVVKTTLRAACALNGNKKVYLLDDGHRSELKQLAKSLGVSYLTRNNRTHFKSGNLTNALHHSKEEFIAVFDADFVPDKNFLEETLPYFVDPKVGIVQTPQVYGNEDTLFSKGTLNLQHMFYNYIMPAKHMQNSAFCVGTNVVYRRNALDMISGFAPVDHSEDVFTTLKINQYGFTVFYVDKVLAKGLSPDNVISFFNQQYRWARGGFTMLFKHTTLFNNLLSWDQRIQYFMSNIFYLTGIAVLFYLVSPLIALLFNVSPINSLYFKEWLVVWSLYFLVNCGFYLVLNQKYRISTLILGIFSFVPYVSAFISVLIGLKFKWKVTNMVGKGLVTKVIAPLLFYIVFGSVILAAVGTGLIELSVPLYLYVFWLGVNLVLSSYLVISSYKVHFEEIIKSSKQAVEDISAISRTKIRVAQNLIGEIN